MLLTQKVTQEVIKRVRAQFARPTGLPGRMAGWVLAHRSSNRRRNAWAVSLLDVRREDRVLEIGFGPGVAIRELSRRAAGGYVCGLDHSEVMLRQAARRNAEGVRRGQVELRLGRAENLPAFETPFDKILAVNAMQFWDQPSGRLGELRRVLKTDGRIAIAFQPRGPGASDQAAATRGQKIAKALRDAGFSEVRLETLKLKPAVVCALGVNASGVSASGGDSPPCASQGRANEVADQVADGTGPGRATRLLGRALSWAIVRFPRSWRLARGPVRGFFDSVAPRWDERVRSDSREYLAPLTAALDGIQARPARILDVGTGTGAAAFELATRYPEAEVIGIDISANMVTEARTKAANSGRRVTFLVADIADFEPDGRFDLITMLNMPPFFDRVAALLGPGGLVINASSHGPATPFFTSPATLTKGFEHRGLRTVVAGRAAGGTCYLARRPGR